MKIGAVILAGGKSLRMGTDKAVLSYEGQSFLDCISKELRSFDERILSINDGRQYEECGFHVVKDIFPDCGPISGLHAALCACKSDALFCIPCDVPLFRLSLADYICSKAEEKYDAVIPVFKDGHIHPLCAVYKKTAVDIFEKQILSKKYKIMDAHEFMNIRYIPLEAIGNAEKYLFNVNTPEEFEQLKTYKDKW
jgi:molybdopterin-guanine dinucleotide biosynthesis protein A